MPGRDETSSSHDETPVPPDVALESDAEQVHGDIPPGIGPDLFRERFEQVAHQDAEHGGEITLHDEHLALEDIQSVEQETEGSRSRVHLRNGVIIGGVTGAAIVAALATVRYRRRHPH